MGDTHVVHGPDGPMTQENFQSSIAVETQPSKSLSGNPTLAKQRTTDHLDSKERFGLPLLFRV